MIRVVSVVVGVFLLAGCTPAPANDDHLTVFAAASLKSVFTELGKRFEDANPGATVEFNFAGSSDLATQLTQGAPADVFASADAPNMNKVVDAGLVHGDPVDFAANTLTIVTAPGNPKHITSFADLTKPGISVVVCAPQVPCGAATEKVEKATGVTLHPVSEESAVTDVLGKVTSGQADAGLVYVTDAKGAGRRRGRGRVRRVRGRGEHLPDCHAQRLRRYRDRSAIRRSGGEPGGPGSALRSGFRRAVITWRRTRGRVEVACRPGFSCPRPWAPCSSSSLWSRFSFGSSGRSSSR